MLRHSPSAVRGAPRRWVTARVLSAAVRAPRRCAAALLLLAAAHAPLPAQALTEAARLDAASQQALRTLLDDAEARGLPTAPLRSKIREGAARGAPGPRIVAVVQQYAEALGEARGALGDSASGAELDAGAAALRAGVRRETLRDVRRLRPPGSATTAIVVLTDLVLRGVRAEHAADAVTRVLRLDSDDAAALALRASVARESPRPDPARASASVDRFLETLRGAAPPRPPQPEAP